MSELYSATHVRTIVKEFEFQRNDYERRGILDKGSIVISPLHDFFKEKNKEIGDYEDFNEYYNLLLKKLREVKNENILEKILQKCISNSSPKSTDILKKMEVSNFNLWEFCIQETTEDALWNGKDLLLFQGLFNDAFPDRFVKPILACVEIYGFDVHPDVASFEVIDEAMAVRLLMETNPDHPLYKYFPEPTVDYDGMSDIIFRIEETGDENETYKIWLPAHLSGNIENNLTWDSYAFPFS